MKIIVFSDSHGKYRNMEKALGMHPDAEYCFFLGDGLLDFERVKEAFPGICCAAVKGNCDVFSLMSGNAVESCTLDIGGKRIYLCHGHRHSVKSSPDTLEYFCAENQIDIAFFGHTHTPYEKYVTAFEKPFYVFNPGTVGGIGARCATYGILEIKNGEILYSTAEL